MIKLLLDCTPLVAGGGLQVGLGTISNAILEPTLEVHLVCSPQIFAQLNSSHISKLKSLHVITHTSGLKKLFLCSELKRYENVVQPDITYTIFGPSFWKPKYPSVQGFALGKMLYPEVRERYKNRLQKYKEKLNDRVKKILFLRNADYYWMETDVVKSRFLDTFPSISPEKVFVIGNSYSPAFEKRSQAPSLVPSNNCKPFRFFVPASYYYHKNLEIIPHACSLLRKRGIEEIQFIFSIPSSSAGWNKLSYLAEQLQVSNYISTAGEIPNDIIADYYASSDAVLCTSLVESSTAVFPESFLSKRPLLVSKLDFATSICEDAALYFNPLDPEDLADKMFELYKNSKLRDTLIEKGIQQLRSKYPSPSQKWGLQLRMLHDILKVRAET